MLNSYLFQVPDNKKVNVIIDTDAKNEADDQYAIVHALLSPKLRVLGITAAHFSKRRTNFSMMESYEECQKITKLMKMTDVPVLKGNPEELTSEENAEVSEAARFIAAKVMETEEKIYILCMGALTNVAAALLFEPEIGEKLHVIWVGGKKPNAENDGREANTRNDYKAVNVVMKRCKNIVHIPAECYSKFQLSLAELQVKVRPYGEIGNYLFEELIDFNYRVNRPWSLGESWSLGDNSAVSHVLNPGNSVIEKRKAFLLNESLDIVENLDREIEMVAEIDSRYALEDLFAKLQLAYQCQYK